MVRRCEQNFLSYNLRVRAGDEVRVGEIICYLRLLGLWLADKVFLGSGLVKVSVQFFIVEFYGHGLRPIFYLRILGSGLESETFYIRNLGSELANKFLS